MKKNPQPIIKTTLLLCLMALPGAAAVKTAETGTGNDVLWIIFTVGLTLLFLMKPVISALVRNLVNMVIIIILLIIAYILIKAILIAIDLGNQIDNAVDATAATLSTLGG